MSRDITVPDSYNIAYQSVSVGLACGMLFALRVASKICLESQSDKLLSGKVSVASTGTPSNDSSFLV